MKKTHLTIVFNLAILILKSQMPATPPYIYYPQEDQIVLSGNDIGNEVQHGYEQRSITACKVRYWQSTSPGGLYQNTYNLFSVPQYKYEDWTTSVSPQKYYQTTLCAANNYTFQNVFAFKLAEFPQGATNQPTLIECDQNFVPLGFTLINQNPNNPIWNGNVFRPGNINNTPYKSRRYYKAFCATAYFRPPKGAGVFYSHVETEQSTGHLNSFLLYPNASGYPTTQYRVDSVLSVYDFTAPQGNGDWDAFYQIRIIVDFEMGKPVSTINRLCAKGDSARYNLNNIIQKGVNYPGTFYNYLNQPIQNPVMLDSLPTGMLEYTYKTANNGCVTTNTINVFKFQPLSLATLPIVCNSNYTLTGGSPPGGQYSAINTISNCWAAIGQGVVCQHNLVNVPQGSVVTYSNIGTGHYVRYINTNYPCSDTIIRPIVVQQTPTINIISSNNIICSEDTTTLKAVNPAINYAYTYWSTNDSINPVIVKPSLTTVYTATATNIVPGQLYVGSCLGTSTATITVKPTPTLTLSTSTSSICAGNPLFVSANTDGTVNWSNFPGNNNVNITHYPEFNTTYSATATHTINSCTRYREISVTVRPSPFIAPTTWTRNLIQGEGTRFDSLTDVNATHVWNFGDGLTSTLPNPYHYFNTPGIYSVTVVSTNTFGCTRNVTYNSSVKVTRYTVGLEELKVNSLKVYPTISNDYIFIENNTSENMAFIIMNSLGQTVFENKVNSNEVVKVNIESLENAIYYIIIGNTKKTYKIIKHD